MSVGVCVANRQGFALATDSRQMAELAGSEPRFEIASEEARKLFLIEGRLAVATHGHAMIGEHTIGDLMEQFAGPVEDGVVEYATALGEWFAKRLSLEIRPRRGDLVNAESLRRPLGFVVAGFDGETGRICAVKVRSGDWNVEPRTPSTENPGVYSFGQSDGIDRLLSGVDRQALREAKISLPAEVEDKLGLLRYDLVIPDDLAGAAQLAESLVSVQLLAQRFSSKTYASRTNRVPGCGGEIRSLAVARDGGAWISGPEASAGRQNPRGVPVPSDGAPQRAQRSG